MKYGTERDLQPMSNDWNVEDVVNGRGIASRQQLQVMVKNAAVRVSTGCWVPNPFVASIGEHGFSKYVLSSLHRGACTARESTPLALGFSVALFRKNRKD